MSFLTWLKFWLFRLALYLTREGRKFRFKGLYDYTSNDPNRYGALPFKEEIREEHPLENLQKQNDVIQVFCQSDKGQILAAEVCRRPDGFSNVVLVLRNEHGKVFEMEEKIHVDQSSGELFSSGGLRFDCVLPLRKWRISFNGLLR